MSCPYLCRQADPNASHDRVIPALCRDPLSGLGIVPGFWHYWNRCTTPKHLRCPRYRRHRRHGATAPAAVWSSMGKTA
jgi:hypothetical protein